MGRPQFGKEQTAVSKSMVKPVNLLKEIDFAALGLTREEFARDTITYKLKAGDMAMHHPASPHCSMPNTTKDRWRRIIILRYLPATFPLREASSTSTGAPLPCSR